MRHAYPSALFLALLLAFLWGCAAELSPPPLGALRVPREPLDKVLPAKRASSVRSGRVVAVSGRTATVDVGSEDGLRPGREGLVEAGAETTLDEGGRRPGTGRFIAEVRAVDVGAHRSVLEATRFPGLAPQVRVGDRVRWR